MKMGSRLCIIVEILHLGGSKMNLLADKTDKNRKLLLICMISVFLWGLAAHNYGFVHSSFSHDSLFEFNGDGVSNYIRLINGRFLSPVCRKLFRQTLDTANMPADIVKQYYEGQSDHDMYIGEVVEILR